MDRRRISILFKDHAERYMRDATNPTFVKLAAVGAIIVIPFNLVAGVTFASMPAIGATFSIICTGVSRIATIGLDPEAS